HAGENVVSMLSRGNIRNEWTRKCYGIDNRVLVQHRALSRDIEGGRFPEERPTKIGLYESAIQIRGKFRKGIPRVEKRVPVIHGQTAVVTLSVSMFGSDFDLRFSRMLEQSGVRIRSILIFLIAEAGRLIEVPSSPMIVIDRKDTSFNSRYL